METIPHLKEIISNLRPYLNLDGGDIQFIAYRNQTLYVKLTGNCEACPFQNSTLNDNLLKIIQQEVPEVKEIIQVNL